MGKTVDEEVVRIAIEFYHWMRKNDTMENAEQFFHFTDEDMFNVFLEEVYGKQSIS